MGNFRRGDRFSGHRERRGNDRSERFSAVCDECGSSCEVPFRPTSGKPIYCDSCFSKSNRGNDRGRRDFGRSSFRDKKLFDVVCTECGEKCQVPFRPTSDKPVYCDNCFGGKSKNNSRGGKDDNYGRMISEINGKIDLIMKHLDITIPSVEKKNSDKPESKTSAKSEETKVAKKAVEKKTTAKKTTTKKVSEDKPAKKTSTKKAATKKTSATKTTTKKPATKKVATKKATAKKTTTKKTATKKTAAKKTKK